MKIFKLLKKTMKKIFVIFGMDSLGATSETQSIQKKNSQANFIKTKNFPLKDNFKRMKTQTTNWEKSYANYIPGTKLQSRLIQNARG